VEGTDICTSEHKDSPSRYLGCLIKEVVEIHLKINCNRDFGIILSWAWSLITSMMLKKTPGPNTASTYSNHHHPSFVFATSSEPRFQASVS
jgi:hypothetical protein